MDGFQHEQPDYWLNFGNPWEIERLNVGYTIKFYGYVSASEDNGRQTFEWIPGDSVRAVWIQAHGCLCECKDCNSTGCRTQICGACSSSIEQKRQSLLSRSLSSSW